MFDGRTYGFHWGRPRSPTETETIFPFFPLRQDGLDAEDVNCYFACVESSSKTCEKEAASRATKEGEIDPPQGATHSQNPGDTHLRYP